MKTFTRALGIAACVGVSRWAIVLDAQAIVIPSERLNSTVDSVRMNAFQQLEGEAQEYRRHPDRPYTSFLADSAKMHPELAAALIHLLERENSVFDAAPVGTVSQDWMEDYITLKVTVGRIEDPASVSALLGGMYVASGPVDVALISFGDLAVDGVLAQFDSARWEVHIGAVGTLAHMVESRAQNHLSDASAARIQKALLLEIQNPQSSSREEAIEGLMPLNNQAIRAVMERVAATDSAASLHPPGSHGPVRYGVRDAARAWLAKHPTTP